MLAMSNVHLTPHIQQQQTQGQETREKENVSRHKIQYLGFIHVTYHEIANVI